MALTDFLTQSADIEVEASTGKQPPQDALGGAVRTNWLPVASGVPCLVRPMGSSLSAFKAPRNDARANVNLTRIYFEGDPVAGGLSTRHRIRVEGAVYKVQGAIDPNSLGELLQVDCERIRTP